MDADKLLIFMVKPNSPDENNILMTLTNNKRINYENEKLGTPLRNTIRFGELLI